MSHARLTLLEVPIDALTTSQAIDRARHFLRSSSFHHIVTPGPEFLLEATAHPVFRHILQQADLSLADGMGLHLGSMLTRQRLPQRIPGADFVEDLCRLAEQENKSIFLFGGMPGVGERAALALHRRYPKLRIVGIESGFRGSWQKLKEHRLIEKIHLARPDILLVALGFPKQELWIHQHRVALHDVRIAMGVGRTLDYIAGVIRRPPPLVRRLGLEWLYTYARPGKYYQARFRRQRVSNATIRFLIEVMKKPHD